MVFIVKKKGVETGTGDMTSSIDGGGALSGWQTKKKKKKKKKKAIKVTATIAIAISTSSSICSIHTITYVRPGRQGTIDSSRRRADEKTSDQRERPCIYYSVFLCTPPVVCGLSGYT